MKVIIIKTILFIILPITTSYCVNQTNYEMLLEVKHRIEATMQDGTDKNYYGVTFSSNGCNFEILVNDVPVYRFFGEGGVTSFYPINPWILSSGEQRIKVRLYPVQGFEEKGILAETPLHLVVKYLPDPAMDLDEAISVIADFIPCVEIGTPYFEYETTFQADVPYHAKGWADCRDLTNRPNLKDEVIRRSGEIGDIIIKHDFAKLADIMAYKFGKLGATLYLSDEVIISQLEDMFEEMKEFTAVSPMSDYELRMYGDSKLAILEDTKEHKLGFNLDSPNSFWYQLFFLGIQEGQNHLEVMH